MRHAALAPILLLLIHASLVSASLWGALNPLSGITRTSLERPSVARNSKGGIWVSKDGETANVPPLPKWQQVSDPIFSLVVLMALSCRASVPQLLCRAVWQVMLEHKQSGASGAMLGYRTQIWEII